MVHLLKFTRTTDGAAVYVNPDHIQTLMADGTGSRICFQDGRKLDIAEELIKVVYTIHHDHAI